MTRLRPKIIGAKIGNSFVLTFLLLIYHAAERKLGGSLGLAVLRFLSILMPVIR